MGGETKREEGSLECVMSVFYTFITNSRIKTPRKMASVEMKNSGMEVRREVVSMAMVMEFRRMVVIIIPLKRGVCMERRQKTDKGQIEHLLRWHLCM